MAMTTKLKPMLAETIHDVSTLGFPVLASPKLDGVRALFINKQVVSRNLKPIRNKFVQAWAEANFELHGLDGELIVGEHDKGVFQRTTSGVMGSKGEPDFIYWVFDNWDTPDVPYSIRLRAIRESGTNTFPRVKIVPTRRINSTEELLAFEVDCLARGFEGVMVRDPEGGYKYGRSTLKQGWLLKLKQFVDAEAIVIGYEEQLHNVNESKPDELGRGKRSQSAAGLLPAGTLGALLCRSTTGIEFAIGTGFDTATRATLWKQRAKLKGKLVKYKSFPIGVKDAPRFPVFLGFRDNNDV